MLPSLLFRLQPRGPWPLFTGSSGHALFPSDAFYAALTSAAADLGWLDEWLEATATEDAPSVRCTSLFPWQGSTAAGTTASGKTLYAPPPANLWPYASLQRLRPALVKYLSTNAIADLARVGTLQEPNWIVDAWSGCLLAADRASTGGPFRPAQRSRTAVDRITGVTGQSRTAECIEFSPDAGVWGALVFADEFAQEWWAPRMKAAIAWLADSGLGPWRTSGWGLSRVVETQEGDLAKLLFGKNWPSAPDAKAGDQNLWWMLSLTTPAESDIIDFSRGAYRAVSRSGRSSSTGAQLPATRCLVEGSVVASATAPQGALRKYELPNDPNPQVRPYWAVALALATPEVA